ncbi:hypothetical protein COLO4_05080 [Corchorus olitorius]|uniref:Endonuclease/exonuclease/phosphatase n=1 Tax=Corchorus olitorius TaxID=93759 RepID=A0A1R3KS38_9ROSI|nr:hypothetical protein COLO4_05080 [Corchorus olitorius]
MNANYIEAIVSGESCETVCIETCCVNTAIVSVSSGVNHTFTTALHSIEIALGVINEDFQESNSMQHLQPFRIVIYNAKGVARPLFISSLQETISVYNPHVLIITETRSILGQHNVIAHCPNYEYVHSIAPFGYLGGSWVVCDGRYVTGRMLIVTRKHISFELEHKT